MVERLSEAEVVALGEGQAVLMQAALPAGLLAAAQAAALAELAAGRLRPAGVGPSAEPMPGLRDDLMRWVEAGEAGPMGLLHAEFMGLREVLEGELRMALPRFSLQLAGYEAGARYARHRDAFRLNPKRRLTAILYLNLGWTPRDGGELQLYEGGVASRRVAPEGGRLVLFRSELLEHEVLPAFSPRVAITAWFRDASPL